MNQLPNTPIQTQQRGVALFISLVLLLVLTIIGVSAVQTTSLEVRMTRNEHDSLLAFQAAEAALVDAETILEADIDLNDFENNLVPGYYTVSDFGQPNHWEGGGIWAAGTSLEADPIVGVAGPARFIIEHVATVVINDATAGQINPDFGAGEVPEVQLFRITARGIGGTDNARVVLQSAFGKIVED